MANHQIDSLIKFVNSQSTEATGTLVQITRNNVVMEVYNPYSIVQLSEVLNDLVIRREDRVIYKGRAVVSTLVNTGLYLVVSATLVDPWQDLKGLEHDSIGIREEAERFLNDRESTGIEPSFQLVVFELRSFLLDLSRWLEQVDLFAEQDGISHDPKLTNQLIKELKTPLLPKLMEHLLSFENKANLIEPEKVIQHKTFVRQDLHPLLLRSPFMWRTFTKPLGYAGDYEMVNMILRSPDEGPTTYAKLLNNAFLLDGPAEGHRNRVKILQQRLKLLLTEAKKENKQYRVLNIACGPAVEIQRLLASESINNAIKFDLLDFNEETLAYIKSQINSIIVNNDNNVEVDYIHKSVHTLLKEASKTELENSESYDLVYCAGLFDYLSNKVCNRLMRLFWKLVKPGGKILVTNVHTDNPVKLGMEYLMEWHLIYRDEKGMNDLLPGLGEQTVYKDDSGINVFLEIEKPVNK